jgi:hypothetical protein
VDGTIYNNHTLEPFMKLILNSQRVKKLALSFMFILSSTLPNLSSQHTRRALSSTTINTHQETVSGQACNPPDPY